MISHFFFILILFVILEYPLNHAFVDDIDWWLRSKWLKMILGFRNCVFFLNEKILILLGYVILEYSLHYAFVDEFDWWLRSKWLNMILGPKKLCVFLKWEDIYWLIYFTLLILLCLILSLDAFIGLFSIYKERKKKINGYIYVIESKN